VKKIYSITIICIMAVIFSACTVTGKKAESADKATGQAQALSYFEVHHDGRLNVFDDASTYLGFMKLGETSYRLTRIGAGPKGQTVVFGLTKKDKKKRSGIKCVDMYDGKLKPGSDFYGEIVMHNRFYVFSNWNDLLAVKKIGEPSYFYTQIGAGPGGKTVVYVLNKKTKKKKPVALIQQFKKVHSMQ